MHKRLVAGLSGLVTCLQSNSIGTNFRRLLFKLRRSRAFSFSLLFPLFPLGRLLIGWLQAARWGRGIPPLQGRLKPRSGHLPAPAAPQGAVLGIIYIYIIIHPHNSYIYIYIYRHCILQCITYSQQPHAWMLWSLFFTRRNSWVLKRLKCKDDKGKKQDWDPVLSESVNLMCSIDLLFYDLVFSAFLLVWHKPVVFSLLPRRNPLLSLSPHSPPLVPLFAKTWRGIVLVVSNFHTKH